ncbi:STAS domain-containing protein [Bacillus sp. CECT 9360]|uniref:STAS domain-containing protein n=1 Tax=Bacillus sp. CECT 9360 TaxID=2845821 RepID=UPI001E285E13|nr:STAS domain-containing protein [Bacillus sp. CECT 9360]CAH0346428.1 hypothetical protein BCI9360_02762 [Bacillus sp. CECT 9360]
MFTFDLEKASENQATIYFQGDLDIEVTEIMEEQIFPSLVILDNIDINLSEVPFVDSTGIGLLINLIDSLKKDKENLVITVSEIQPQVEEIFEIIQLSDILGKELFGKK